MSTYSNAQVRAAILSTASLFESKPALFNFWVTTVPPDCGTPGCALGYVCHFLEISGSDDFKLAARAMGCGDAYLFYKTLDAYGDEEWDTHGLRAARALRAFANARFPAEKPALDAAYAAFKRALAYELGDAQRLLTSPASEQREGVR